MFEGLHRTLHFSHVVVLVSNLCGTPKKINGVACTDVVCTPIE